MNFEQIERTSGSGHPKRRDVVVGLFKTDQISLADHWIRSSQNEL